MKTRAKKILKNVVSAIIILCMISQSVVTAFATQNRTGNFSKSYSLSGNGATDIVRVAAAQLGRTGSQLGYSEQWCADFVSDCAILANQSAAIPAAGYCPTLRQNIINAGGQYVSKANAKAGDIVFYGNNGADHVEIVYAASNGNVSTYGGNSGSEGSLYSRKVKQHATQTMSIAYIVRPNYSGAASSGCNCSTSYAGTYIVNTSQYPLTMRSGHGTGYSAVTTIPKGTEVTVLWNVINTDTKEMYFSIGAHPAFLTSMTLEAGPDTDHLHVGDNIEGTFTCYRVTENAMALEDDTLVLPRDLPLTADLFSRDAIISKDDQASRLALAYPDGQEYVVMQFDEPIFGLWSPTSDAPFVCLEPWHGRCDADDFTGTLQERAYERMLEVGGVFNGVYTIGLPLE